MKIIELKIEDEKYIDEVVEMEKSTFGEMGGVNLWILKPLVKFGKVFVILKENKVIGCAEFIISFDKSQAFLYGFSIKIEYQNHGLGAMLLKYCDSYFTNKKISEISLTVDPKNITAITLYKHHGYFIDKLNKDEYDKGIDRFIMKKIISKK